MTVSQKVWSITSWNEKEIIIAPFPHVSMAVNVWKANNSFEFYFRFTNIGWIDSQQAPGKFAVFCKSKFSAIRRCTAKKLGTIPLLVTAKMQWTQRCTHINFHSRAMLNLRMYLLIYRPTGHASGNLVRLLGLRINYVNEQYIFIFYVNEVRVVY